MLPEIIALCGNPKSGKTTAGEILSCELGYIIADDGLPLRRIAMEHLGLTQHQVFTQAGKLEEVDLNGRKMTVRQILGEIGNAFEEKFGADIIPMMTHRCFEPGVRYVLTSVRREQGLYWKRHGALVIEMVNEEAPPSPYEFDRYSSVPIDVTIFNEFSSALADPEPARVRLRQSLVYAVSTWTRKP